MWRRLSWLLGLTTTLHMMMVWALPTSSSLSTIPGMLKSNHGIQDNRPRWLGECTLCHHQRESSSFYDFFWLYLKVERVGSISGPRIAKCLLYSRKHIWQGDYWRMIMSGGFAWRKRLQYSLEWHVIGCWQLSCWLMKWLSLIFSEINSRLDYVMMSSTNYII